MKSKSRLGTTGADYRLPGFLIIGAMKAGTTTLYEDLSNVKGIYLPPEKEPNDLILADVESDPGVMRYARKYSAAPYGSLLGDASTAYAKRPTYEGVAGRACRVLGPDLKVIYMVRDPIRRIVSQYHHLWGLGEEHRPINEAVLVDERYVAYSRYDWQLEPWRACFPASQILVVHLESYVQHRAREFCRICEFLEVGGETKVSSAHRNKSAGKAVAKHGSIMAKFAKSPTYLYRIKPIMPRGLRDAIKSLVLPKTAKLTDCLDPAIESELRARIRSLD